MYVYTDLFATEVLVVCRMWYNRISIRLQSLITYPEKRSLNLVKTKLDTFLLFFFFQFFLGAHLKHLSFLGNVSQLVISSWANLDDVLFEVIFPVGLLVI